ncbi:ferric oxidoreductase domain-containing protein [Pycnococcus provasolii]
MEELPAFSAADQCVRARPCCARRWTACGCNAVAVGLTLAPLAVPVYSILRRVAYLYGTSGRAVERDDTADALMVSFALPVCLGALAATISLALHPASGGVGRWRMHFAIAAVVFAGVAAFTSHVWLECATFAEREKNAGQSAAMLGNASLAEGPQFRAFHFKTCRDADVLYKVMGISFGVAATQVGAYVVAVAAVSNPVLSSARLRLGESLNVHALLGRAALVGIFAHGALYVIAWWHEGGVEEAWRKLTKWQEFGVANAPGALGVLGALILYITSHNYIRRVFYTLFYVGHIFGTLGFYILGVLHAEAVLYYCVPGSAIWAAELARRCLRDRVSARVTKLGTSLSRVELDYAKSRRKMTTSLHGHVAAPRGDAHVYLSTRCVSRGHPFSVVGPLIDTDDSEGNMKFVTYVRSVGVMTKLILEKGEKCERMPLCLDGPHETFASHRCIESRTDVLFVAGGTGIVPLLQLIHARVVAEAADARESDSSVFERSSIRIVFAARDENDVHMLELLPAHWDDTNIDLDIIVYTSGDVELAQQNANAALSKRSLAAPRRPQARDGALVLSATMQIGACVGVYIGLRASCEMRIEPTWALRLYQTLFLNGAAFLVSFLAGVLLRFLRSVAVNNSKFLWSDNPSFEYLSDESVNLMALNRTSPECPNCIPDVQILPGRADILELVREFAEGTIPHRTRCVVSSGSDALVDAVDAACRKCGVAHTEATVRLSKL